MKMDKPTQEQIKEIAKWCGFTDIRVFTDRSGWDGTAPDGKFRYVEINLNNLFKYAFPKFMIEYHNWRSVLHNWVDGLTGDYEKDTFSLYWLLTQTI